MQRPLPQRGVQAVLIVMKEEALVPLVLVAVEYLLRLQTAESRGIPMGIFLRQIFAKLAAQLSQQRAANLHYCPIGELKPRPTLESLRTYLHAAQVLRSVLSRVQGLLETAARPTRLARQGIYVCRTIR